MLFPLLLFAFPLAALAIAAFGLTPATIPALYLAAVTPALIRVDVREHRLPNRMVVPGLVVGLASALLGWTLLGCSPFPVLAGLAFGGSLWLLVLAGGIGMGDVKLAALIGFASPTPTVAVAAPVIAFLTAGVVAVVVLIRRGRSSRIAFGPFLLAGYFAAVVLALGGR
ncbi:MAG TPA: A24 family peptidase [Pseudolysinimonas sp.]|jgi:leader peptidase (prepilin peptidase)/N-methyltransferase|nr:A24 family peptidase [Pseudolysinimonas sp.]